MLTEEKLINSPEFKYLIKGNIMLIHNTYHDSKEPYGAFIVVSDENRYQYNENKWSNVSRDRHYELMKKIKGQWTITRFFEMAGKIQHSIDYIDISTEETFKILLTKYSRGLE